MPQPPKKSPQSRKPQQARTPHPAPSPGTLRAAAEQQRTAQLRRRAIFAAVALTVVAAATAAGIVVGHDRSDGGTAGSGDPKSAPASRNSPNPAHVSADGTTVVYGDPNATRTLDVYEDFRCPVCRKLEATDGATIRQLADQGKYRIAYHLGTFLDDNLGGSGSMQALAAAGAALNRSPKLFKEFHDVLYANQPEETSDGFADRRRLLELAAKVPGLVTPQFTDDVEKGAYLGWAQRVTDAFGASGVTGTPTLKLDGRTLTVLTRSGPITPDRFRQLVG